VTRLTDERRTGLGGTDAAPILGLSRFRGPTDVYMEKLGLSAPLVETEAMEWGNRLEDAVCRKYAEAHGVKIRKDKRVKRHPKHRWMLAHIDRWLPDGILDGKTAGLWATSDWGEQGTDEIPDDYRLQAFHYMAVTNLPYCAFALLIAGQKYREYRVERDMDFEAALIEKEREFWIDHVLARVPPPVDGSDSARELLGMRYPRAELDTIDPPEGFEALALEWLSLKAGHKDEESRLAVLGNLMREALGTAEATSGALYSATWRNVKLPSKTDWPGVVRDAGVAADIVERNTTGGGTTRRFEVRALQDIG
jgi:putative phage-type endonuclease